MNTNISIVITSCWRIDLLKKTIISLKKSCDLDIYEKYISEDTKDYNKINKIKKYNKNGFLKWWKITFTWWKWQNNYEKHYNAVQKLYENITSKYIFHCEDDCNFKKVNFDYILFSKRILEENKEIWIVQLRNFEEDWGYNHIKLSKKDRKRQLFEREINILNWEEFLKFRNDKYWDKYNWFSLNPWLRRTEEMKKIMFWFENSINEINYWERMKKKWLYSINFKKWIVKHTGNSFLSTKILEKWALRWLTNTIQSTLNYRIKELFIHRFLFKKITKLYYLLDTLYLFRLSMDILSYFFRIFSIKKVNKSLLQNIEWITEMNVDEKWFYRKKNKWISWVARLKNASDFLETVVDNHLEFLDELILVDNNSSDNTKKICLKLEKKYPNKIRFFEYNYKVFPPWTERNISSNSLHSLAYYYNWSFSQSNYSHVMKVDDDNILIKEKWGSIIKKSINSKNYNTYWWVNLIRSDSQQIGIPEKYKFSWRYWDHWIYKVSPKTYYIQGDQFELFKNNLFYIRNWFWFFHLKFLKKSFWFQNLTKTTYTKEYKKKINSEVITDFNKVLREDELKNVNIIHYMKKIWN